MRPAAGCNAELTAGGLATIGCGDIAPEVMQKLDSIDDIDALRRVGASVGARQVQRAHFDGFA